MRKLLTLALLIVAGLMGRAAEPVMPTVTGEPFLASDGKHINAHGGAILLHDGTYYWYGEHRGDGTPGSGQKGVACYTSTDLKNWDNKGIVLSVTDSVGAPLERGCIIERPKVVYNPATGKFVMWFHHEMKGVGYGSAYSGVAVSDSPTGPFVHLKSGRINPGIYPENLPEEYRNIKWPEKMEWWTPEWRKAVEKGMFTVRDHDRGQMARDMTVFVDDDGKAYHVYSSEENLTLNIAELDSTYTRHTGRYIRIFPGGHNEAPALFKHNGTYWMIASGCTGWAPNEARLMKADNIMGDWTQLPNPCRGEGAKTTFDSQSTAVAHFGDRYTFMADMWRPKNLADSRHLWLPIKFDADGTPYITKD